MDIIIEIAWHAFVLLLWLGGVVAILLGAGLLIVPQGVARLNRLCGRRIDTRSIGVKFDRPRLIERHLYRHHRLAGSLLFIGAAVVLYRFLLSPAKERMEMFFAHDLYGLFDAGVAILVIGNVLAAAIGGIVFFRPSLLRGLEDIANRWISTDRSARLFGKPRFSLDRYVLRHRLPAGGGLIIAGAWVSFLLGKLLFLGQWHW